MGEAKQKEALNAQLKEYIAEWRKTREKEEDELKKLKEKQAKRKEIRAEQKRKRSSGKRKMKRRPRRLKKRRRSLKKLKLPGRKCLRRKRRLPSASESSLLNLMPWTLMSLRPRLTRSSTLLFNLSRTNMTMNRGNLPKSLI